MTTKNASVVRFLVLIIAFSVTFGPFSKVCQAQNGKDIAGGLLKALIESQLEKSRRRSGGGNLTDPFGQPQGRPGRPQPLTQQMQQLRPIVSGFAQETATLGALLQTDARRSIEARRQLPSVIRLQATATALKQRSAAAHNHALLLDDFRTLNSDWATLSHQLTHCRSLGVQTTACVKRLSALDGQYCSLLGIQEQFNDRELVRAAYTLTTYVNDLADDARAQPLPRSSAAKLMRSLGQLNQKTEYFAGLVSQGARFQTVVAEYQDVYRSWIAIEPSLSVFNDHSIARSLRRIRDSHQTIHQLLRIEIGLDKNHVLTLVHEVEHHVTELFKVMTLEQLMALPDGGAVPDSADALLGTIQNVDDHIHRDETPQAIGEAWVYADEAWNQFSYYVSPIRTGAVPQELQAIAASMHSLQQALGVTVQYDRNALVQNASSLENLAERLVTTLRRWQSHPGSHDRSLVTKAQRMVDEFHHIEQALAAGDVPRSHLSDCDRAIVLWQQIRPVLKTCTTDEREQFAHIVATLTPEIVRLRTMLDE